ncbi:peptidase M16 [Rhodospirillum rubrum]|uniref:M16 family metallopeptidase n=1 Tax=Rhodospirillum rubrum TaxID=1085 RepID=UPI0019057EF6|nr:pitrilysin family protein [Rhodospirillum rubrum]MBK1664470.1 peptidase M16 [Rhodospirillum rubrum]MBK1676273.1 peptidase M16 [Rhodospirillum rubrum]
MIERRFGFRGPGSRLGALIVLVVLGLPALARAQVFNPETFTLQNGMEVVVIPNHRVPVVHHMVWYKIGAADEPAGKSGLAHLLEHLMFKGTPTIPPGEFSKIVARNGGQDNAFTSSDFTAYFQSIAKDRLPMVMEMEADRMANLRLSEEDFQTEREVVREERRSRTDNEPGELLSERIGQALWGTHPYKNPIIGWEPELMALTRADALAFYDRYYAPNNAILVVAGDITAAELKPLAERTYGALPRRDTPQRASLRDPLRALPPPAETVITMHHAQVAQPSFSRRYVAPSAAFDPQGMADALEVLDEILGGGSSGRLYKHLVIERGMAVSAGSWYRGEALDWGSFGLYASPRDGVTMADLVAAVDAEVASLLDQGVKAAEVDDAKRRLTAGLVYARDSLSEGARALGEALTTGSSVAQVESWPERIKAVTPEQVSAAARAVLGRRDRSVTGFLLPEPRS